MTDFSDVTKIIEDAVENAENLSNLSNEELVETKKKINFYGIVPPYEKSFINISITNLRDDYMRKLYTTALIGYLFRMHNEYEEYEIPEKVAEVMGGPEKAYEYVKKEVRRFIERHFNFNPDKHVESSYKDNLDDPERAGKLTEMKENMKISNVCTTDNEKLDIDAFTMRLTNALKNPASCENKEELLSDVNKYNKMLKKTKEDAAGTYNTTKQLTEKANEMRRFIVDLRKKVLSPLQESLPEIKTFIESTEDCEAVLLRNCDEMQHIMTNYKWALDIKNVEGVYTWITPINLHHQFDRYVTNHYELLREAVKILYSCKPDIEYSIQHYMHFTDEEEAVKHRRKYENNITTAMYTIENGCWTLLGPFKKNRERVDFYNKHTEVIKNIFEQGKADMEAGGKITKHVAKQKKKKNIDEVGPDAPGLATYKEVSDVVKNLGGKEVLTKEEKEKLNEAKILKDQYEVPEGHIMSYVWKKNDDGKMVKTPIYIEEETESEMKERIETLKKAQKGLLDEKNEKSEKILKSKSGKTLSLKDLRESKRVNNNDNIQ